MSASASTASVPLRRPGAQDPGRRRRGGQRPSTRDHRAGPRWRRRRASGIAVLDARQAVRTRRKSVPSGPFWSRSKQLWSLDTVSRTPARRPSHSAARCSAQRIGGEQIQRWPSGVRTRSHRGTGSADRFPRGARSPRHVARPARRHSALEIVHEVDAGAGIRRQVGDGPNRVDPRPPASATRRDRRAHARRGSRLCADARAAPVVVGLGVHEDGDARQPRGAEQALGSGRARGRSRPCRR